MAGPSLRYVVLHGAGMVPDVSDAALVLMWISRAIAPSVLPRLDLPGDRWSRRVTPSRPAPDPASDRVLALLWQALRRRVLEAQAHGGRITLVVEVEPGGRVRESSQILAPEYPARVSR